MPLTVCDSCLKLGGPLDARSISVRELYRRWVIHCVKKIGPRCVHPSIIKAMMARHLPREEAIEWAKISVARRKKAKEQVQSSHGE